MSLIKIVDRVAVRVTATESGDWQVVDVPPGFFGITAASFADNDFIEGHISHEDGAQFEVYSTDDGSTDNLLQVLNVTGTVVLRRPTAPYRSSASNNGRMTAGTGIHTLEVGPTAGVAQLLFNANNPVWRLLPSGDSTPDVTGFRNFITAGGTTITRFDGMAPGQRFTLRRGTSDIAVENNAAIVLAGGGNITLTTSNPIAEFVEQDGVAYQTNAGGRTTVDPTLGAIAALSTQADRLPYFTSVDTAALATLTASARNLLAQDNEAAMRGFLQLGNAATLSAPAAGVNAGSTQLVRGDDQRVLAGGAGGVNRLVNWAFDDGTTGWTLGGFNDTGLTLTTGTNLVEGGSTYGRADKVVAYAALAGSPAADKFIEVLLSDAVPATPSERLSFSCEVAYYRTAAPLVRLFGYDRLGVSQGELASVAGGTNGTPGAVNGDGMARVSGFVDIASDSVVRSVRLQVIAFGAAQADPRVFVTRAAVQAVSAATTVHPPQAPGQRPSTSAGLLDTTGYNNGRVSESKAPVYMPAWITPQKVGAVGNGTTDDTAAFQTMLNDGRPVCLTQPSVAWRLSSINVPARRQIFADGIRPPIRHFGSNPLWVVQGSNVRVGDFYVECGTGYKADTGASIVAIDCRTNNIERVDMQNIIGVWTGGVFSDIGLVGQYDEVRIEKVLTILQRGVGIRLLRSFAAFWTDYVFMEWLRGQPGTTNGGLYLDETVADINQPMVQVGSNQTAGAGGQLFMRTYCQGANRTDAPNNHGYLLTGPAGGVRLQWCDVDGAGGDAFNSTFFDEIELYDVRFTSIWGHGIVLDEASNVRGTARISGRLGNTDGSRANRHAVYVRRDCARVDLDVTLTDLTGVPARVEGRDLFNDLVSVPNRTRRGNESITIDVDAGSQLRGELLEPNLTYLRDSFGIAATGTPDVQVTGPIWASAGPGGVAAIGRVSFNGTQGLAANLFMRNVFRFNQTTAATSSNPYWMVRINPVELLSEQWITIDFWARCETATSTLLVRLWKIYGTGGSAAESVADEDVVLDSTWRQFSRSFRAPSSFGKTVGTGSYGFVGIYMPPSVTRVYDFTLIRVRAGGSYLPYELPIGGISYT